MKGGSILAGDPITNWSQKLSAFVCVFNWLIKIRVPFGITDFVEILIVADNSFIKIQKKSCREKCNDERLSVT